MATDHLKEKDVSEGASWEASRVVDLERSQSRAWRVALSACAMAVLAFAGLILILPLKESVPYVVRVDNTSGQVELLTKFNSKDVSFDEVMDKYWLASYVRARESYDWYSIQAEYNTVTLLSNDDVARAYGAQFEGANAVHTRRANRVRIQVEIISIVPLENRTATVRYLTKELRPDGSGTPVVSSYVATIAYDYRVESRFSTADRLVNPFGFVVNSYRSDRELAGGAK